MFHDHIFTVHTSLIIFTQSILYQLDKRQHFSIFIFFFLNRLVFVVLEHRLEILLDVCVLNQIMWHVPVLNQIILNVRVLNQIMMCVPVSVDVMQLWKGAISAAIAVGVISIS